MSRRAVRVHRRCGARLPNRELYDICPACNKWLVGDAVDLVRLRDGTVVPPRRRPGVVQAP